MNYSLTGKARIAAKNTLKQAESKRICNEKFSRIQEKKTKREAQYIAFKIFA